jgi:hypothetical protein
MLFDLQSGKRRRVVQIIFGFLAFIFFISFVGFGIGSDVSGGIFDALGIGTDSSGNAQYEDQIEDAEKTLEEDAKNQQAMLDLVRYNFLSATEAEGGVTVDQQTGARTISEDSRADLEATAEAWNNYLATDPKNPDPGVAANAAQAFVLLEDADGAAQAQRIVAEASPSQATFGQLAFYLYADGKLKEGDAAAKRAVELADPSQRQAVAKSLRSLADRAREQLKAIEKAAEKGGDAAGGSTGIENPFGGLSGGGAAPVPAP